MKRGRHAYDDILTPREWEVIALIRQGLTNEQIASRLGISHAGAKYHVAEICSRLGASTRQDAVKKLDDIRGISRATSKHLFIGIFGHLPSLMRISGTLPSPLVLFAAGGPVILLFIAVVMNLVSPLALTSNKEAGNRDSSSNSAGLFGHSVFLASADFAGGPGDLSGIDSLRRVKTTAELERLISSDLRLIVVEPSLLSEAASSGVLNRAFAAGSSILALNIRLGDLANAAGIDLEDEGLPCQHDRTVTEMSPSGALQTHDCSVVEGTDDVLTSFALPDGQPFFTFITPPEFHLSTYGDAAIVPLIDELDRLSIAIYKLEDGQRFRVQVASCDKSREWCPD